MKTDNYNSTWAASGESRTTVNNQDWFWSSSWQSWEAEAEADLIAGRYETFNTDSAFLASLEEPRRYVQPALLFLPLALLMRLWRRLKS